MHINLTAQANFKRIKNQEICAGTPLWQRALPGTHQEENGVPRSQERRENQHKTQLPQN
jgi:hypothetical protein